MKLAAEADGAVRGEAAVPGDKSCSHRALILGAMADGATRITGLLESEDVLATARAIASFGIAIDRDGDRAWTLRGGPWGSPPGPVDCGNSGTAARLLIGAIAGMEGRRATVTGDSSLRSRPMGRVTLPLERMGARFIGSDRLPLTVEGARLGGIAHRNEPPSAQVKSAILIAGLGTSAPVSVIEPVASRDHSEIMLGELGCDIMVDEGKAGRTITLGRSRKLQGCELAIGADPSSAAFPLLAAAIVPGSDVLVRGMLVNPLRTGFYEVLEEMGADIELTNERIVGGEILADVRIRHQALRACQVGAARIPAMVDEIPALAVACAFADGESLIEGLAELRVKESDRLGAIIAGLTACGVVAAVDGDSLRIFGRASVRGNASILTRGDHRIAMAFLVLGLAAQGPVEVDEAEMIGTSFPGFVDTMQRLGANIG
ncbi:3-phosphoshikimate 1-carboxyvinyltransferase [Sphingomonas xanthus]|uniref:3-phosphoshikimate 1-carboxyvinyltransferase n=1 Tax=Sphingomonas xanthus TaxID=2594473 RepID=A0A516IS77_9SPHN|nr:3-phosphoshikimate 1-carboxyvinyltransferase [Sphingomonas xanthus]QDP19719.1 3-phosphoshikimate 1-carboxyvinyltransferase [Sphingomonas xanthus]